MRHTLTLLTLLAALVPAAAFAGARAVITTMHTEARFPLKRESAALASEARNRALLPGAPAPHNQ